MSEAKITPMLEQYRAVKAEQPEALLMFRMGDFFEFFFEDAEIVARELQLVLTSRNPNSEARVPMAGVPHHAAVRYVNQLLEKGYCVTLCDQVEDPKKAKGLVKRAVTRIFTPGTVIEEDSLEPGRASYLVALYWNADRQAGAACWADVSTGHWSGLQMSKEDLLWQWAAKLEPREIILPDEYNPPRDVVDLSRVHISHVPAGAYYNIRGSQEKILDIQKVKSLETLDLADKPELVQACGAILTYLLQTHRTAVASLEPFRPFDQSGHMLIDDVTQRNLEIFTTLDGRRGPGTLRHVLDRTVTPMGGRLLEERLRSPWMKTGKINPILDAVAFLHDNESPRRVLRELLGKVHDLERLYRRIAMNQCSPRDFLALRQSLAEFPNIKRLLEEAAAKGALPALLKAALDNWDDLGECAQLLDRALSDSPPPTFSDTGIFKAGYHPLLDELINLTEHSENELDKLLELVQRNLDLPKLKAGYNRVFGYYFEVSKAVADKLPYEFIRRQSLANAERFTTPELKELEDRLINATQERRELEYNLFLELQESIRQTQTRIMYMAQVIANLDYCQGLAEAARTWKWTRPEVNDRADLEIIQGRHPVVEAMLGQARFIPNNLHMHDKVRIMLITGPNMAGKSTILRQTALICIMAQIGSFVPAEAATLGIVDRVFSRVGASDNLSRGLSTFMVEMSETARILRQVGKKSLIILDEIGRGTSTFDGLAIAWAVMEDLVRKSPTGLKVLFATHYHELTKLEDSLPGLKNFNIGVVEENGGIVFTHRLLPGPSSKSYGVEVAKLAGIPRPVVARARDILEDLEKNPPGPADQAKTKPAQAVLPGLAAIAAPQELARQKTAAAFVDQLSQLEIDRMTPIEALTLLNKWKKNIEESTDAQNE